MALPSILVVDDEPIVQLVIKRALERAGYTVVLAGDYEQAVERYLERINEIGVLIADVRLPNTDGIELARRLLSENASMRVLFISGWTGAELIRYSGMDEIERYFLPKPFKIADLISAVERRSAVGAAESTCERSGDA